MSTLMAPWLAAGRSWWWTIALAFASSTWWTRKPITRADVLECGGLHALDHDGLDTGDLYPKRRRPPHSKPGILPALQREDPRCPSKLAGRVATSRISRWATS